LVRSLSKRYPTRIKKIRENLNNFKILFLVVSLGWAIISGMAVYQILNLAPVVSQKVGIAVGMAFGIAGLMASVIYFEVASALLLVLIVSSLLIGGLINGYKHFFP
jgi:hypothetical protein